MSHEANRRRRAVGLAIASVIGACLTALLGGCSGQIAAGDAGAGDAGGDALEGFAAIPAGDFDMGDHAGFVDPKHPSDELPIHTVHVDALFVGVTEVTNAQLLVALQAARARGDVDVSNGRVVLAGGAEPLFETTRSDPLIGLDWDGSAFTVAAGREQHPAAGVHWLGAAAYCNWSSRARGLAPCYDLAGGTSSFASSCFRLPTEAEWEYAGRGGRTSPYAIYPWGDEVDPQRFNFVGSNDPWELAAGSKTTPVGFFDGSLRRKADYGWPGGADAFPTADDRSGFGLHDMAGNVWEWVNDWYGKDYYSVSRRSNPMGPSAGDPMPDGKPYRVLRGGSFYNSTVYPGDHERVSNRDPGYFRGPGDPNGPWFHVGFRVAFDPTGRTER